MQRISQKVYETDKGLWNTIKKWFENLVAKLKKLFADLDPQSENGRIVREMGDRLDSVRQMWADMVIEAGTITTEATQEQVKNSRKDLEKLDADYLSAVERGDMEAAQKMVDEAAKKAGYNVKAYHGTPNEVFTEFKDEKIGSNTDTGIFGHGFYFSTDKDTAVVYATEKGNIMPVYLDLGKVWWAVAHRNINDVAAELEMDESALVLRGYGGKGRIVTPTMPQARQFTSHLQNKGYNSVVVQHGKGNYEIVIFNSNRIKSSDPVTYDDGGNVIPLSQRFNEENEDIRHSVKKIVDENGNDYGMGVYLDSTLLSDLTESERIEMVKEYVKELGGKSFTAFDSNHNAIDIHIAEPKAKYRNKNGKKVLVNKDLVGYQKSIKQESIALVDELILTSKYTNKLPAAYPHGWLDNYGQNDWEYWTTYLQDKENTIWKATLNIATTANGEKILYDIVPIEKVEGSVTSDTTATNNNISQTEPIVNTNSENFSEILNSRKTVDPITSREELAKALSKVAKGEDRAIVESYKANVNLIKGETARLESLRKEIDEIKYKKSITYEGRELSVKEFEQIAYTRAEETGIEAERVKFKEQSLYKKDHDKKS